VRIEREVQLLEDDALLLLVGLEQDGLDCLIEHVLQVVAGLGRALNVLQGLDLARELLTLLTHNSS
jgi:hypothetical protein